jgi:putative ABC transport system permease protein
MKISEILRMALGSLGANKLRSSLTMLGITIGVFSVIGVMTAVTALRDSVESGLSFLGSNIIQIGKTPVGFSSDGSNRRRFENRRDITLADAQRLVQLLESHTEVVCLKLFNRDGIAQATYENRKTTPGLTFGGTDEYFLIANQYSIATGRNFTKADTDLARPVIIIGQSIVSKLFPSENPLGKSVKILGKTYQVIGTFAERGSSFGRSQDDVLMIPITRFVIDFGGARRTVNIAIQAPSQERYNETVDKITTAMRIVRGLRPEQDNDFELLSNDSLISAFAQVADAISAARPGARGDQGEAHLRRLEDLQQIALGFEGVEKVYAVQAGREVRILVRPDQVTDEQARTIAHEVVKRIEEQLAYPGQIRVTVIRETRAVDYAR